MTASQHMEMKHLPGLNKTLNELYQMFGTSQLKSTSLFDSIRLSDNHMVFKTQTNSVALFVFRIYEFII